MSSPVLWYLTRASGLVALMLLTATTVLGVLTNTRLSSNRWPGFAQQEFHRRVALMTMAFLVLHVATSVLDSYVHIGWAAVVVPLASPYKRLLVGAGAIAVDLLLAVIVSSLLRHRIGHGTWRALHWLAYTSWPVAFGHALGLGTDMRTPWVLALAAGCAAAVAVAVVLRIVHAVGHIQRVAPMSSVRGRPSGLALKYLPAAARRERSL